MGNANPHAILASTMVHFSRCVDGGEALKVLETCADEMTVRMGPHVGGRETMEQFLTQRQNAVHQTRHVVGWPAVEAAAEDSISGTVPVTAFRMVEGVFSVGVADFRIRLVRETDRWLIQEWELHPFILHTVQGEAML